MLFDFIFPVSASCSPVCHCRSFSLTLGQGEATFPQVELQSTPLDQPVSCLQNLRSQGLWLSPLLGGLAAPGSRFGHDTPWGGRRLGLLTDAIEVFHRVFPSFTSTTSTTTCKHGYLNSNTGTGDNRSPGSLGFLWYIYFRQKQLLS